MMAKTLPPILEDVDENVEDETNKATKMSSTTVNLSPPSKEAKNVKETTLENVE